MKTAHKTTFAVIITGSLAVIGVFAAYSPRTAPIGTEVVQSTSTPVSEAPRAVQVPSVQGCDPVLWSHVYHPQRLIQHGCATITGTIVDATNGKQKDGVRHEADGDTHGWIKVDPQYENMLNAGNMSDEGGNLVFEIVCYFPVKQADAVSSCQGYQSPIVIPPVGTRVRMTGTFVQDTNHAQWNELHPVSEITPL